MVKIRVRELKDPKEVALDRIYKHYGFNCYPLEPHKKNDHWIVPFEANVPITIADEKRQMEKVIILHFDKVGEIAIGKNLKILDAPTRISVEKKIRQIQTELRTSIEEELIEAASFSFAGCDFIKSSLSPIKTTTISLLRNDFISMERLFELEYMPQVNLMIMSEYAKRDSSGSTPLLVPSEKLKMLYKEQKTVDETAEAMIGIILSQHYRTITDDLKIKTMKPYVGIGATYYEDALEYGDLIEIKQTQWKSAYLRRYGWHPKRSVRFDTYIYELDRNNIIELRGRNVAGIDDIFDKIYPFREKINLTEVEEFQMAYV